MQTKQKNHKDQTDRKTGQTDSQTNRKERQTDQTDRKTDKTDRPDRETFKTERRTKRQTDRQIKSQTDRKIINSQEYGNIGAILHFHQPQRRKYFQRLQLQWYNHGVNSSKVN